MRDLDEGIQNFLDGIKPIEKPRYRLNEPIFQEKRSTRTERGFRPQGRILADFLTCESCGSKKFTVTPATVECLDCHETLGGELAKLAVAQILKWKIAGPPEVNGPRLQVFSMQQLAEKVENLSLDDSESKSRIRSTVRKLAEQGEYRPLSTPKLGWADLLYAFEEMHPNFAEVLETSVRPSLAIAAAGGSSRPTPALLLGSPGTGKSFFAECLARHLEIPSLKVDMSAQTNGSALAGSSAFWANSSPGELFKLLAFGVPGMLAMADPLVFVDEIDKINPEMHYNPLAGLFTLLEVESAKCFEDQSFPGIRIDASRVRWILACNETKDIPAPILSRAHVFEIPELTPGQKRRLFARIFQLVAEGTGLQDFEWQLPDKIIRLAQDMGIGMREFKNLCAVAIGRALEAGRWEVDVNDFRRPGCEIVRVKMGFR